MKSQNILMQKLTCYSIDRISYVMMTEKELLYINSK